jgi:Uma2 family endonuclease
VVTALKTSWLDSEYMELPQRAELVDGKLINMANSGIEHGYIASTLIFWLMGWARSLKLGIVLDSSTAFTMKSGNRRSPDISFLAKSKLKNLTKLPKGYWNGAPDLAVEILSPSNTVAEMNQKIVEYFDNGTQVVWLIHPDQKFVMTDHQPHPDRQLLLIGDFLSEPELFPNCQLAISELFAQQDFQL